MSPHCIFLSYRRGDSAGHAGRLADDLTDHFGDPGIFRDLDSITPGTDFVHAIESAVATCRVFVPVIGPGWLTAAAENGSRRLDDPGDFVRLEIEAALRRKVAILPVLVEGADMPCPDDLPPSIARLARYNAMDLRDGDWEYGIERLVGILAQQVGPTRRDRRRWLVAGVLAGVAAIVTVTAARWIVGHTATG